MPLHLLKLCVGAESIQDLQDWITERLADQRRRKKPVENFHTTRMVPKRVDQLLDGGSLYWVIKGQISVRQRLEAVRPFTDGEGISRCHLLLEPVLVTVLPRPFRPFQGWRYLKAADAPRDLGAHSGDVEDMPEVLRRELSQMGLL